VLVGLGATIESIYAAAAGERSWQDALHSIEELTGSAGAVIGFVPHGPGYLPFNIAGRFTAEQCATYSENYQSICRRTRYMIDHPTDEVVYDSLLITEQEINRDPVYDWFGQHGLRYFVGAALPSTLSHFVVFTLQRSAEQGHVQVDDLRLFGEVKAHLGRAVTLAERLGTLRRFERFSATLLEALPQALFALDASGQIRFANAAATDLVRACDGLSIVSGRLQATLAGEQSALDTLIVESAMQTTRTASGWTRISRANGKPPYAALVAPLRVDENELASAAVRVMVVVHDLARRLTVDPQMLAKIYALTDTEARLASAIAGGHGLESASILLGMQIATARSHLKSIFAKLDVNRQQDMVRLITILAAMNL